MAELFSSENPYQWSWVGTNLYAPLYCITSGEQTNVDDLKQNTTIELCILHLSQ